jgi:hypothetical protein
MISIANVSVSSYQCVDGTNLAYAITYGGQLVGWNMSQVIVSNLLTMLAPAGTVVIGDWPAGITWTRTLPTPIINGTTSLVGAQSIVGISADQSTIVLKTPNQYWGFSTKDGTSLWNLTLNYPVAANEEISLYGVNDFIIFDPTAATFKCYSMLTGALLWTSPSFSSFPWATTWTVYYSETNDYNNFYAMFPDGTMAAYSLATGQLVWHNTAIPSTEYTANAVPYVTGMVMVGGNIYAYAGYSILYQANPVPRFGMMTCVNATTGDITYTLNGGVFPLAAADGYVIGYAINDGKLYCVGKGQTSTTVSAPQTAITAGTTVIISGTVLDQSAAQPNTAAISDENMSVWMDYLNMQNSTLLNAPPACIGVPVTLIAVDPNGNAVTIGTATSDYQGNYGFQWTPTIPGLYHIYATFAGSNSYYTSSASTYATVASASSSPSPTSTPIANPPYELYTIGMGVAIIVAIAVVGLLLLRKRP